MSAEQEQHDGGEDGDEVENADSNAEFKPVVELPSEHTVQTGEEEDEVVYKQLRIVHSACVFPAFHDLFSFFFCHKFTFPF